jgi:hypothetical protein
MGDKLRKGDVEQLNGCSPPGPRWILVMLIMLAMTALFAVSVYIKVFVPFIRADSFFRILASAPFHAGMQVLFAAMGFVFWKYFLPGFNRNRQLVVHRGMPFVNQPVQSSNVLDLSETGFVLYLRSFRDDKLGAHVFIKTSFAWKTEEEQVVEALAVFGRCVAVGRPGEPLPELGATRLYFTDTEWMSQVRSLMLKARLVVLRIGGTDGLLWELQEAVRLLMPQNVVVLIPDDPLAYRQFTEEARRLLSIVLPPFPSTSAPCGSLRGVVLFGVDWKPQVVRLGKQPFLRGSGRHPLPAILRVALRPVCEQLGLRWLRPPINKAVLLIVYMFIICTTVFTVIYLQLSRS